MKNSIELMTAFYALQKLRIIVVWVNCLFLRSKAEFILRNSGARGVFIFDQWDDRHYLDDMLCLKNGLETLESIILAGENQTDCHRIYGISDLINQGGYKIYPHELECILVKHPKVEQVCIVATPNPVLGESICVCVIPRPGQKITLGEIRESMKDKIAPHKLPDELCILDDFPKLSGG